LIINQQAVPDCIKLIASDSKLHPTPDSNGYSDWEDCNKKIPVSTPKAVEGGEEDDVKELKYCDP
jgi:hypothetical protein